MVVNIILPANANNINKKEENLYNFKDLSIIMPSYDKYSELWNPAFEIFFKYWSSLNNKYSYVPIYLMSNEEKFDHPRVTNILVGDADKGWSSNFLKALESVKTKYVVIVLDDYILNAPVNEKRLAQILNLMRKTNAAYTEIALDPSINDGPPVQGIDNVHIRERFGPYRTSLQACIWEVNTFNNGF